MNERLERLIQVALTFIGIKETSPNEGAMIEEFQKSVDGKYNREAWCMAFVQYCIKQVEKETSFESPVYKSESCMQVWEKSPQMIRIKDPVPGSIMIWKVTSDINPNAGHAGIVIPSYYKDPDIFDVIEGNTSTDGSKFDGVNIKIRTRQGSSKFKPQGWLLPWI